MYCFVLRAEFLCVWESRYTVNSPDPPASARERIQSVGLLVCLVCCDAVTQHTARPPITAGMRTGGVQ